MNAHEQFSEDCAAYVLGALPEEDAAALREHMGSCGICGAEVERLVAVADALGRSVPTLAAPPELRAHHAVEAESSLFAAAAASPRAPRRAWRPTRPLRALAAVVAVAFGVVVGFVLAPGTASTRVIAASVAPAPRWRAQSAPTATLRETGERGVLVMSGLPPAPAGKIYEIWIERGRRAERTDALFNATSDGHATVAVPNSLGGAAAVLVTAERLGGASAPTMAPLITARLG